MCLKSRKSVELSTPFFQKCPEIQTNDYNHFLSVSLARARASTDHFPIHMSFCLQTLMKLNFSLLLSNS